MSRGFTLLEVLVALTILAIAIVTLMGSIRETVTALAALERSPRLLALKDLKMRVVTVGQPRELLTTLVVAGYLMPPPAAAAKSPGAATGASAAPPTGSSVGAKDED